MSIDDGELSPGEESGSGLTRRNLLVRGAQASVATAGLGGLLAACGGSSSGGGGTTSTTSTTSSAGSALAKAPSELPGGTPKSGGTFTLGCISNGTSETLWPGNAYVMPDWSRQYALFMPLFYPGRNVAPLVPGLALSAEPNAQATNFQFHLRENVTWHDGKPFTADDVVYNFKSVWTEPTNAGHGIVAGVVDFAKVRKTGTLTVEVPLLTPMAEFPTLLAFFNFLLVQNGATKKSTESHAIGVGPFMFESFIKGQRSVFKKNPNYFEEGKPYVDELIVDSSFTEESALLNALLSGAVNLYPGIEKTAARTQLRSKEVQIIESSPNAESAGICMRTDKGPFVDNRIRQAFKLLADRQVMIDSAQSGFGVPGNDCPGPGSKYYASDLTAVHDPEKAKSLFKQAGALGQTFTFQTANVFSGQVESLTILAQQAAQVGVTVNVQKISPAGYFSPSGGFLTRYGGQDYTEANASLPSIYRTVLAKGCPYPDTHWAEGPNGAAKNAAIQKAIAEVDPTKASELWKGVQEEQHSEGGYIWWTNFPLVDAAANNVRGLQAGCGMNFYSFRLQDGWLE